MHLPLFLLVEGRRCVVVGAGRIAGPRVEDLVGAGADVVVVAPDASTALAEHSAAGAIECVDRAFRESDLDGAFMAVGATDDAEANRSVHRAARARGCLVNVVDTLPLCDWITPSVVRHGDLAVAISTAGRAPALAADVRARMEGVVGPAEADLLARARFWRRRVSRCGAEPEARRRGWQELTRRWMAGERARLPRQLELPVLPEVQLSPESRLGRLGVVGTGALHGPAELVARVRSALGPGLRTRVAELRAPGGDRLVADAAVIGSAEGAEVVFESPLPELAAEGLLDLLADRASADRLELAELSFAFTASEAAGHLFAAAAGLRSVAPLDPAPAAAMTEAAVRADPGGMVRLALRAATRAGGAAREAGGGERPHALATLAARYLAARAPQVGLVLVGGDGVEADGARAAVAAEGLAATGSWAEVTRAAPPGGDLDLAVMAAAPGGAGALELAGKARALGWRRAWLLDLGIPPAWPEPVRAFGLTRWDLGDLADVTVRGGLVEADLPAARQVLAERLRSFLGEC